MKNVFIYLALLLCLLFRWSANALVLAPSGTNAVMVYKAQLLIKGASAMPANAELQSLVRRQTQFLMGLFEAGDYAKYILRTKINEDLGILALQQARHVQVLKSEPTQQGLLVTYAIAEEVLVHKRLLKPDQTIDLKIFLPFDPVYYYDSNCVQEDGPWRDYYFAYWQILNPNCRSHLKDGRVQSIDAKITGINGPNPDVSPSYDRLLANARRRGELNIAVLLGFDQKSTRNDDGRKSYNHLGKVFRAAGFQIVHYSNDKSAPFVEMLLPARGNYPAIRLTMNLSLADRPYPITFARRAKWAFENADIFTYSGHAGLGGNLNLKSLETALGTRIRFNDQYQIYYFGACNSLYWYLNSYELAKRGKRNVDIVTDGLESYFSTQDDELLTLLQPFITGKARPTWYELISTVEKVPRTFSYFMNVGAIR